MPNDSIPRFSHLRVLLDFKLTETLGTMLRKPLVKALPANSNAGQKPSALLRNWNDDLDVFESVTEEELVQIERMLVMRIGSGPEDGVPSRM